MNCSKLPGASVLGVLLLSGAAGAGTNQGAANIAGVAGDINDSNVVTLTSTTLSMVKKAFEADGTPISTGTTLPRGTVVKFLLYVNNDTPVPITDLSVQDVLDPTFAYETGTLKVDNSVANCAATACTSVEEDAIFAAVDATSALTDAVDGDAVSYTAGTLTVDIGNESAANTQVDVAANSVYAILLTAKMQ